MEIIERHAPEMKTSVRGALDLSVACRVKAFEPRRRNVDRYIRKEGRIFCEERSRAV
jgi:hypothetical protein